MAQRVNPGRDQRLLGERVVQLLEDARTTQDQKIKEKRVREARKKWHMLLRELRSGINGYPLYIRESDGTLKLRKSFEKKQDRWWRGTSHRSNKQRPLIARYR